MECRAKIAVLGGCGCGKSSVTKKFLTGSFDPNHGTTIGAAYQTKRFERNGEIISMDIWDTAGQERYSAIAPMYYRDAHTVLVVYDVTDTESVGIAKRWCTEVRMHNKDALLIVFGNKTDLVLSNNGNISSAFIPQSFSGISISNTREALRTIYGVASTQFLEYDATHLCGSAKTGEGIDFLFKTICTRTKYAKRVLTKTPMSWWCF